MDLQNRLVYLPIGQLEHHPKNPRVGYSGIEELAESLKAKGVMQNLTVVKAVDSDEGKYYVVIGNRRLEAARLAGLSELPCAIAEMSEQEIVSTMLVENIQRSDLTAFEEAQGFQLMLDLGETVSSISEKTGFSETTVRRRVKLTELDKDKFRKASDERQVSLSDLDKLGDIKNIETRNKLLDVIGTPSFNYELSRAKNEEKRAELEKVWRQLGKEHKLKEIPQSDRWSGKYSDVGTATTKTEFEKAVGKGAEFFSPQGSMCFFYKKSRDEKKAAKKSKEQIEREERLASLFEESERMYASRLEFVKNVSISDVKGCENLISRAIVERVRKGIYLSSVDVKDVFGENESEDSTVALFKAAYCMFEDTKYRRCFNNRCEFEKDERLSEIYTFLEACGYPISEVERAMIEGTSEMFNRDNVLKGEIKNLFPEVAFDETFVSKMFELLKSDAGKEEMCKLVTEYAKGKVCDFCGQDDKCDKRNASAKCWKADEYYVKNAVDEIKERARVIRGGNASEEWEF